MTAYTTYTNGTVVAAASGANAAGYPAVTVLEGVYDATKRNMTAADTMAVITIPEGTYVLNVGYEVLAADASQTLNIGDGTDPDGWIAAADVGTLGNTGISTLALTEGTPNTVTRYTGGKYYSAADTLDLEVPSAKAYDTLKVRVFAVCAILGVAG